MDRARSVALLNQAVTDELLAIHQYMYFHFHLDDQGFGPLAMLFKTIAMREMVHVEMLAERILFLKGEVEMVVGGEVEKITDPEAMLAKAAAMEEHSAVEYNRFAKEAADNADAQSKQLFEVLIADEESHYDSYDKQMDFIKKFGPSYLALQSFSGGGDQPAAGTPSA